jgi:hypothetical protein
MIQTVQSPKALPAKVKKTSPRRQPLPYSLETIRVKGREYLFNYPPVCILEKEENHYIITHPLSDLTGTGLTLEAAELDFNEEFDYLYSRLNALDDARLSKRPSRIKSELNRLVKEIR